MKLLWLWILILFGIRFGVVRSETKIGSQLSDVNQWEKIAMYLYQVMLNDESMSKGHVNLLILDFTMNHDIDELVEHFHKHPRIFVTLINTPVLNKLGYPDFVIIIQDFMQLDATKTQFKDDFENKLDALIQKPFMSLSSKYYIINNVDTKLWTFPQALKFVVKCVNVFLTEEMYNLMILDRYDSKNFAVIKPYVKDNLIFFQRQSILNAHFPASKMGEMGDNIIKLQQFDQPPFSKVENGKLLGTEGRLLDALCERYNTSYIIVNNDSTILKLKDFGEFMYNISMDLNLNYVLRIDENKYFDNIILNKVLDRCLLVPRNIPLSTFDSFSCPFDDRISICLFCATCLVIVSWKAISFAVKTDFSIDFIAFSVFRYLMGNSATLENRMSYKEKFIVYGYVWASLVLLTLYESYVISFMMADQSYRSVTSLEELNSSNTKIYEYFMDGIQFKDNLIVHKMFAKVDNVILKMPDKFDVNMAYLVTSMYADAFIDSSKNYNNDGHRLFDKLQENVMSYVPTYVVKKSFPLRNELKHLMNVLRESGIEKHWIDEMFNKKQNNTDSVLAKNVVEAVEKIVLTFKDMKVPFVILDFQLCCFYYRAYCWSY
ncbi:unnamed protein product [Diamesa serratosioi]